MQSTVLCVKCRSGSAYASKKHLSPYCKPTPIEKFRLSLLHDWPSQPLPCSCFIWRRITKKSKGFPYSLPSVRPGADPGVQAVSPHVTVGCNYFSPGRRLPTQPQSITAHWPVPSLVTEAHRCEQLDQGCYAAFA